MNKKLLGIFAIFVAMLTIGLQAANAHCDHVEGPVIKAAKIAIAEKNVNYILIWVQPEDEVQAAILFNEAMQDIASGDLGAENEFYADLVRLHRKGEGASYEGIKSTNSDMDPMIVAADAAIETGNLAVLHPYVSANQEFHDEVVRKYIALMSLKKYNVNDTAAGRIYVASYVDFMEFIEGGEEHESRTPESSRLFWIISSLIGIPAVIGIIYARKIR